MNLEAVYFISQVIAAVALVGSLVFVGIQIRQVSFRQKRETQQTREATTVEGLNKLTDPEVGDLWYKLVVNPDALSEAEISRAYFAVGSMMVVTRARFHDYKNGLLSEEHWLPLKGNVCYMLTSPGFRAIFTVSRQTAIADPEFDAEFAEVLEQPPTNAHKKVVMQIKQLIDEVGAGRTANAEDQD
ncbi:hypothetical protein [Altererythrobacter sp. MF3-039]|uniref:hypothetical protein n=1 Tax=Altererythrobacter sp. MF3-039 TaxID=3252901 RepID=UPI00390C8387